MTVVRAGYKMYIDAIKDFTALNGLSLHAYERVVSLPGFYLRVAELRLG